MESFRGYCQLETFLACLDVLQRHETTEYGAFLF